MAPIGTWLLANIFPAVLPPVDPDEREFFDILGVPKNATNEQIRKAYKVKSLKLHPDKVAQRRGNMEEAAKEYELVQEAYGVLVNDEKRQTYRALNFSPTRYRFLSQGALANPGALYENLTNSTVGEKTRLVLLFTAIVLVLLLQPILITAKVNHLVEQDGGLQNTNWTVILLPFWALGGAWVALWAGLLLISPAGSRPQVLANLLQYFCWYLGVIFLALKWDGNWTSSYAAILIPCYLALALRWMASSLLLFEINRDVGKMVTVEYLEREVLKGKTLEDLTEAEGIEIKENFLVVTVPPEFEPVLPPLDPENPEGGDRALEEAELETQKVEASPEYLAANEMYFTILGNLVGSIIFGLVFVIILTLKLDDKISASYWVVFLPLWIYFGCRWFYNFYLCACATVIGSEVLMEVPIVEDFVEEEGKDDSEGATNKKEEASTNDESKHDSGISKDSWRTNPSDNEGSTVGKNNEDKIPSPPAVPTIPENDNPVEKTEGTTGTNGEGGDPTHEDDVHVDEETFRAWQSAYAEAERGAMEEQAKTSGEVCLLTAQLLILFLVVAKIDKNEDNDDPDDAGFNAFWILFPFFLFFGVIICCCACLIYGAAPGSASDLAGNHPGTDETTTAAAGGDVENPDVVVMVPPPPTETVAESLAAPVETSTTEPDTKKEEIGETTDDIEDLD